MKFLSCCVRPRTQETTRQSTSHSPSLAGQEATFSGYKVTEGPCSKVINATNDKPEYSALRSEKTLPVVKRTDTQKPNGCSVSKTKDRNFLAKDIQLWGQPSARSSADYRVELNMDTINASLAKEKNRAQKQQKDHFAAVNQDGTAPPYMYLPEYRHVNDFVKQVNVEGLEWSQQDLKYKSYNESSHITESAETATVTALYGKKGHDASSASSVKVAGKEYQVVGVYDGHGKETALDYAKDLAKEMPQELERKLEEFSPVMQPNAGLVNAMKLGCATVDRNVNAFSGDGSTACVAVLDGQTVTLLNAGDSRAVAIRATDSGFIAEQLTTDQKILDPQFLKSTEKRRGNSIIAERYRKHKSGLARKCGDFNTPGISARPKVTQTTVGTGDYLVIASDGIYDFMLPEQLAELITRLNTAGYRKPSEIAPRIMAFVRQAQDSCLDAGIQTSRDDLTVTVTQIKPQEGS